MTTHCYRVIIGRYARMVNMKSFHGQCKSVCLGCRKTDRTKQLFRTNAFFETKTKSFKCFVPGGTIVQIRNNFRTVVPEQLPAILEKMDIGKTTTDDHFVGTGRYDWKISESKRRDRSTRPSLKFVAHNAATQEAPTYATLISTSESLFVHS